MDFLGNFWNDAEMMGKSVDWTNWKMPRPLALLNPPTRAKHDLRVAHHKSSTKGHQPIILRWRVTFSVVDVHSPNLLWFFLKVRSCFFGTFATCPPGQHEVIAINMPGTTGPICTMISLRVSGKQEFALRANQQTIRRADCFHSACNWTKRRTKRFALMENCIEMDDLGYPLYIQRDGRDICISTADKDPSKQSILTYGSEGPSETILAAWMMWVISNHVNTTSWPMKLGRIFMHHRRGNSHPHCQHCRFADKGKDGQRLKY